MSQEQESISSSSAEQAQQPHQRRYVLEAGGDPFYWLEVRLERFRQEIVATAEKHGLEKSEFTREATDFGDAACALSNLSSEFHHRAMNEELGYEYIDEHSDDVADDDDGDEDADDGDDDEADDSEQAVEQSVRLT